MLRFNFLACCVRLRGRLVDIGAELWEWGRNLLFALVGLLGWYFKRSQDRTDKRLDDHEEDIQEQRHNMQQLVTRPEFNSTLKETREHFEARHATLDKDVKNLGAQLSEVVRRECATLRQEQQQQNHAVNERLDKMMMILTTRADR